MIMEPARKLLKVTPPMWEISPEMLYRQVQFLVEESDWSGEEQEIDLSQAQRGPDQ